MFKQRMAFMGYSALIALATTVIGVILIAIILHRNRQASARFLALFLFTVTASSFFFFLFESRYLFSMPYFLGVGPLLNYLAAPALFFSIVLVLDEKRLLRWRDTWHLLPAALFLVDGLPLYLSSHAYKRYIITGFFQNDPNAFLFSEDWLISPETHFFLRHLIALGYIIFLSYLLRRHFRSDAWSKNRQQFNWMCSVLLLFSLFSLTGVMTKIFFNSTYAWAATGWEPLVIIAVSSLLLLFNPGLLYSEEKIEFPEPEAVKPKQVVLYGEIIFEVQTDLRNFIQHRQFLRKNIKLREIAEEFGVQPYILSAYINQVYHLRFNDLINWCRIQYVKDGLTDRQWNLLTLEAIADEAGFSNRTTFRSAFKKFTGMTPTAFLQKHRKRELDKKRNSKPGSK